MKIIVNTCTDCPFCDYIDKDWYGCNIESFCNNDTDLPETSEKDVSRCIKENKRPETCRLNEEEFIITKAIKYKTYESTDLSPTYYTNNPDIKCDEKQYNQSCDGKIYTKIDNKKPYEEFLEKISDRLYGEIGAVLNAYMGRPISDRLISSAKSMVRNIIHNVVHTNWRDCNLYGVPQYEDLIVFDIFIDFADPKQLKVNIDRNFAAYPMDEKEYEERMGCKPQQDDLHRVNCCCAGACGHYQCGWCLRHSLPRFKCGCLAK